ncbi:general secretion pathway protein E/type IV pilus assembly protein PilB [Verrucomicrobium sp. GAS474]|uniref:GspE/PulE family protein n=1 Tax=Verrucomicrobium sp. GAS474 TaxID=1882831 RepID=UPI0008792347|nr:ATPase, T2SS/T4P/T4SS family [Verrucomicrobium sp. GAS474]SDU21016.1 general secretion pathway protein E/type IV pilus assembly protein PilB [Verrucomicrobium sp. GAS474]
MLPKDDYILELLIREGVISSFDADEAKGSSGGKGKGAVDYLIQSGKINEGSVVQAMANDAGLEFQEEINSVSPKAISLLPRAEAARYGVVPISFDGTVLRLGTSDPYDYDSVDALQQKLGIEITSVAVPKSQIDAAIREYYGDAPVARPGGEGGAPVEGAASDGDAPIIRMVNDLIIGACSLRASDIHLEPLEKRFRVRYRIDGVLQEMPDAPKKLQGSIISRLKIMSKMSIAEKRLPQDGRIQIIQQNGKQVDLRVSTVPTVHGEGVVMRILDKSSLSLGLPELGFLSDDQTVMERLLGVSDGIVLVTGPTGSGKTTTLYGCLNFLNKPDRKIITVEDPVEYQLSGINQVPVNEDVGMTFSAALRAMLRQAPNIVMVGEIRDAETAGIAINASLTGHLVFSTLHTNDAPSAVSRLIDIGIKPFLVASSLRGVLAQRLVRKICSKCKVPHPPTEAEVRALNLTPSQIESASFSRGAGCDNCRGTGFKGRCGIFEIFQIDDEIRSMINDRQPPGILRARARALGMRTMREDGIRKVLVGMTTPDEVITTTMGDK